jgi:hypothetical protein
MERLAQIESELAHRAPNQSAGKLVKQTNVPVRTCYQAVVRLAGPRDAVLDYAAWLMSVHPGPADSCHGELVPQAVEEDDGKRMSLVLSRDLYAPDGTA